MAQGTGSRHTTLVGIVVIALAIAAPWATAAPFFMGLGNLYGGEYGSFARAVSADGTVVVGGSGAEAFRWTQAEGMVGLGDLPGGYFFSKALGVSADGSVVVGTGTPYNSWWNPRAFRWTLADGMVEIGGPPGGIYGLAAWAASSDGSVVVGYGSSPSGVEGFRWTDSGGMVGIGDLPGGDFYSTARGVSADGSVVVGSSQSEPDYQQEAVRWTESGGMVGLGHLPGEPFWYGFRSEAMGVSDDGSVVVGWSESASTGMEAFRWTEPGGMQSLGRLWFDTGWPAWFNYEALDVSSDGSVVVGEYDDAMGGPVWGPFLWTLAGGMQPLQDVLVDQCGLGEELAGWHLGPAWGISADGMVVVGSGMNPNGQEEAWIARVERIPEPASVMVLLGGLAALARRRRRTT